MAKLNITYGGQQGDLPDPVDFNASDEDIRVWAREALATGIPGIDPAPDADFSDFVVDRFNATGDLPERISLRPKTPFG